jgi:hypothetical protein
MRFERLDDASVVEKRRDRFIAVLLLLAPAFMIATGYLVGVLGVVLAIGAWFRLHRRL